MSTHLPSTRRAPAKTHPVVPVTLRDDVVALVRRHPLSALGNAVAVGYALRFVPLRSLFALALRFAAPSLFAAALWKAADGHERTRPRRSRP